MAKRKDVAFWESSYNNTKTFQQYYNRLLELSIAMFEWKDLPDTVDARYLELALFGKGMSVFFKDEVLGFLCLNTTISGNFDVYGIPKTRRAFAVNGYNKELDEKNSVIIFNNLIHTPSKSDVEMMAKRLYEFDRIIDVNVKAQKTPVMVVADENERLTMKNLFMKYDGNEPFIFGDKGMNPNGIKALKTDAPFVADKIYMLKTQYWNEALTYLGISNVNVQKKERMVSDEVVRNMGGVISSRYSRLEARRKACEQINKMFNLNISVDFRDDFREADDEVMFRGDTGDGTQTDMATDIRTK